MPVSYQDGGDTFPVQTNLLEACIEFLDSSDKASVDEAGFVAVDQKVGANKPAANLV